MSIFAVRNISISDHLSSIYQPVSLKVMEVDWEQNKKTECIGVFHSTPFCDSPQPKS